MSYVKHKLRSLIDIDPKRAKEVIIEAFTKARCHYGETTKLLGCKREALRRWAKQLDLQETMQKLEERAERQGWHHGKHGGGSFHKDPTARADKARETRKVNTFNKKAAAPLSS